MTTTLLPNEQVQYLRSIKNAAIFLIAMQILDAAHPGMIVSAKEMSSVVGIDARTCRTHMQSLSHLNILVAVGDGFVLAQGGRANFLPAHTESIEAHQALAFQAHQALEDHTAADGNNGGQPAQIVQHKLCSLKKEEEESLILKTIESSSSDSHAQNVPSILRADGTPLTVAQILAATPLLEGFGEQGVVTGRLDLDVLEPQVVLGWLAQAYAQRDRLATPPALVYVRLRDYPVTGKKPAAQFYVNPLAYLPDRFLEVLRLITFDCAHCAEKFLRSAELEAHMQSAHADVLAVQVVEAEAQPVRELYQADHVATLINGRLNAEQAWQGVVEAMRETMPSASWETWLKDTFAVDYAVGRLTVGCRNAFVRDWLGPRVGSDAERILSDLLGQRVAVEFVVYDPQEADDAE